eukprot:scaffold129600_cov66-Attheya_sp.AAC.3
MVILVLVDVTGSAMLGYVRRGQVQYHHAYQDILEMPCDTALISTTPSPSTTSVTIQDIEQRRVKRFIYLDENRYHHAHRDILETSDTTRISTTSSTTTTSITIQDKYVVASSVR